MKDTIEEKHNWKFENKQYLNGKLTELYGFNRAN